MSTMRNTRRKPEFRFSKAKQVIDGFSARVLYVTYTKCAQEKWLLRKSGTPVRFELLELARGFGEQIWGQRHELCGNIIVRTRQGRRIKTMRR